VPAGEATEQPQGGASSVSYKGATKRYGHASAPAVDHLDLEVEAGEICVLVGPSGCGKTTSMRMVNRMIELSEGDILIGGESVKRKDGARLRREIGYVIQQVGLLPHLTVGANVATVPRLLRWDKARIRARTRELLELVGLDPDEYAERYPAQLSGGQQQRVGLARALAADPPVMLMDEPFSAVDPITRERLQNDFLRLHRAVPKTVVFVSHDIDEAVKMADRVAVMRAGKLIQYAPPAELLANPADEFVADFVGADRALKSLSLTRVEEVDLIPAPLVRVGEPADAVQGRIDRGALAPVAGHLLVATGDGRPLDWLPLERLERLTQIPASAPGGAEPVIDHVTTLRDALSALFESNSAYGPVVDDAGRCIGLIGTPEISAGFRRAGNIAAAEGSPQPPAPVDAGAGAAGG
jgi:osmoprotectant transport system ATP-binding protein